MITDVVGVPMSDVDPSPLQSGVREVPTFFGPAESPLFGVVHMPVTARARGAVLICGSIGKDNSDNLRGLRLLGDQLAQRGILAMRFDYLGTGDSSFGQLRDGAVGEWQQSIDYALDYLAAAGFSDVSAVALRAGSLILDDLLAKSDRISRVVYWDPPSTGRRFLREQIAFFKIAVGDDDVPAGVVSLIGTRLSERAAAEFSALKLSPTVPDSITARLIIGRSEGNDAKVTAAGTAARSEAIDVPGLALCAQPSRLLTAISLDAIDAATEWLDAQLPGDLESADITVAESARIAVGDGSFVTERIERIGPHSMFAIRCLPDSVAGQHDNGAMSTVAFFTNANNPHHGPNREWVELSRSVAARGRQALRWDRRGAGESVPAGRDEAIHIYSDQGIEDALAATAYARQGASDLQMAGVCSGSWYAAQGATRLGADSVVFVNALLWSWRVKKAMRVRALPGDSDEIDWEQTPRAQLRRRIQGRLPAIAWRQLGRTGVAQAPEVLLAPLARRGVRAIVILCPKDAGLFSANRGYNAVKRLRRRAAPPEVVETAEGDHAAYHQSVLQALRRVVLSS